MNGRHLGALAVSIVLALGACGSGDDGAEVTIETFQFAPDPIEIEAGTRITFRNFDKINHSVTAGTREAPEPDAFEGVMAGSGDTFELTLDEPGTYDYFCKFHPGEGMTARVVVR